jgi:multimeric flavodoxin WrbA
MTGPLLTKDGQEVLDIILNMRPAIMREGRKKRYMRILSLLMNEQGCNEAGKGLVLEAVFMIEPGVFEFSYKMRYDPEAREGIRAKYDDTEVYLSTPILVRRWDSLSASSPGKSTDQMKVIGICASPRKGGNNDILVGEALSGAEDAGAQIEKIQLGKMKVGFCIGCMKCKDEGFTLWCVRKDDVNDIFTKIVEADAVIVSFPIFWGRECGQLAALMDRLNCFERFKFAPALEPGRRAMVIGTWGVPKVDAYDHVIENLILTLNDHQIETVEAISVGGLEGVYYGVDENKKAIALRFPEEMEKVYRAGRALVIGQG